MTQPMDMTRQEAWELAVQVAKGLLAEFTSELQINALSHDDVLKAIRICIDMRDEPEMSDQVGLFMLLADQKTDGVFSAQVDSWCEKGKH